MSYQNDRIKGIPAPLPKDYDRQANFTNWEVQNPGEPPRGTDLDAEFNAIQQATDETQARLRIIQRDDGALANQSVGIPQLKAEARLGLEPPVPWEAFTRYTRGETVIVNPGRWYYAAESHVSSNDFLSDLQQGKWELLLDIEKYTVEAETAANQAFAAQVAAELARDEAQAAEVGAETAQDLADNRATDASQSVTQVETLTDGVLQAQSELAFLQGLPLGTSFIDENGDLNFYVYQPDVRYTITPQGELVFARFAEDDPYNTVLFAEEFTLNDDTQYGFDDSVEQGAVLSVADHVPRLLRKEPLATRMGFDPAVTSVQEFSVTVIPNGSPIRFVRTDASNGLYTAVDSNGDGYGATDILGLQASAGASLELNIQVEVE